MKLKTENRLVAFSALLLFTWLAAVPATFASPTQSAVRLAIVDLLGDERGVITALLRNSAQASTFELLDADLTRAAAQGSGYVGNLNLSRVEARALGQSLGCDFYVLGKVQLARRLAAGDQFYFDALAGLFFVETRTGRLILFTFERAQAPSESEAQAQLKELIKQAWARYEAIITTARAEQTAAVANLAPVENRTSEVLIDDMPTSGTQQPIFYQRLKPSYTEQADLAGITGTVELEVVFGADGQVGEVEVVRWAGFGLDEAALATVRQLRFQPATRAGKPLTIRGVVRYNFRRPLTQAASPQAASPQEIERLKRSLRELQYPKSIPGQRP
jgi:TonB family protein